MRQPNPEDPTTYPQYDARVHDLPLKAKASAGDTIDSSYVGRATIIDVYPCTFYGAPPVIAGDPAPGGWDGMAYEALDSSGRRRVLDRSRLGRVTAAQPPAPREPVTSSSLSSAEGGCVEGDSSEVSLAAASQAEDASPVTGPITAEESCDGCAMQRRHDAHRAAGGRTIRAARCLHTCDEAHRPITPAQHVGALSMPFDGARRS